MANAIWPIQIIGSGPDRISVEVSEDAYAGDAQFTLSVDGVQIDGVQTATAAHAQQQRQTFLVDGNFGPGSHVLGVNFLNDAYGGTPDTDRNLWLEQVQSGDVVNITTLPFFTAGLQTVGFAVPPPTVTIGAGPDVIGLHMAEDAFGGDAQFTVSIDGVQVGGVQTATALHNTGQDQLFQILGDFGTAPQSLTVNFLNDSYGGTPETDRNLYVTRIDRGGITNTYDRGLFFNGAATFRVGVPVPTGAVTLGSGPDSIVLGISEDAYLEHARFTISVDGTQIGNVQTATTSHGQLRSQPFTVLGDFGPGPHAVAVTFLNDAYGGTPDADRNLWVDSITYAGLTTSVRTGLFWNGATTFDVQEPAAVITGSSIVGPPGGHAVLNGTPGDDTIVARGSGNYISGNGGSDIVTASASGGDTIVLGVAQDGMLSLKEVVAVSGAGNVVAAGDEAVSLSGAASDTIAKLGNGANTLALDGAGNVLETGSGINNLTMTGGDATIRILRQYPAVTPQVVDPYADTITLSGEHNSVQVAVTLGKFVIGGAVTINGGTGFGTFDLGWGSATVHTGGPGNKVSFGAGNFDITPGSGGARVSVNAGQSSAAGAIHLAGDNNVVQAAGAQVAVSGGGGGGTYSFDESWTSGGQSSLVTSGPGNTVFQRKVAVAMQLGGGGDTVRVLGGTSSVAFNGSGNMLFLQPSEASLGSPGVTTVLDHSVGLEISLTPGFGSLDVSDLDPTAVFHLLGGIGGFTNPDQAAAAVLPNSSGGSILALGSDTVAFTGAHLTAGNFMIG